MSWEILRNNFIVVWRELQKDLILSLELKHWLEVVAWLGMLGVIITASYFLLSSFREKIEKWNKGKNIKLKSYASYKRLFYLGIGMITIGLAGFIASLINVVGDWGMSITVLIVWGYTLLFLLFKTEGVLLEKSKGVEYAKRLERELKEKGLLFYTLWKIISPMIYFSTSLDPKKRDR